MQNLLVNLWAGFSPQVEKSNWMSVSVDEHQNYVLIISDTQEDVLKIGYCLFGHAENQVYCPHDQRPYGIVVHNSNWIDLNEFYLLFPPTLKELNRYINELGSDRITFSVEENIKVAAFVGYHLRQMGNRLWKLPKIQGVWGEIQLPTPRKCPELSKIEIWFGEWGEHLKTEYQEMMKGKLASLQPPSPPESQETASLNGSLGYFEPDWASSSYRTGQYGRDGWQN